MKKSASRPVDMGKQTNRAFRRVTAYFADAVFDPKGRLGSRKFVRAVSRRCRCSGSTEQGELRPVELEALHKVLRPNLVKVARMALEVQE